MTGTNSERGIPHSLEAEENLLSSCLLEEGAFVANCMEQGISRESFYDLRHGVIFEKIAEMFRRQLPISATVLAAEMIRTGTLESVGGIPFLTQVSDKIPTTAQAGYFLKRVCDLDLRRKIIRWADRTCEEALADGVEAPALLESAVSNLIKAGSNATHGAQSWQDSIAAARARVLRQTDPNAAGTPDPDLILFGIPDLDRYFGPMSRGQLVILGARPSVGKSSLARQSARDAALRQNRQVLFASLEVMGDSLARNIAQTVSGISWKDLSPTSHPEDVAEFKRALDSLGAPRLDVLAASSVSLAKIRTRAMMLRQRGTPVDLLVVDHLGLLPDGVPAKGETRASALGRVSRELKQFALTENCVVLALSQLNRESEKSGREPALYDLRESGDLEQDADKVIFLHRPDENPETGAIQSQVSTEDGPSSVYVKAIQAKGRDDGTSSVALYFNRRITRFEQIAR